MGSLRLSDTKAEQEVARFLDTHFYSKKEITDFIRYSTKDAQLSGKDVTFTWNELKNIIVDEKAQVQYVNKNLPTFAFEIDFIRADGTLTQGWLFDAKKDTQYYLLIWITAKKDTDFCADDIIKLDCLLIDRLRILDFLKSQGLTSEKVKSISAEIRAKDEEGPHLKDKSNPCYFYFTKRLAEAPVNLLIYKYKLKELSTRIFEVNGSV